MSEISEFSSRLLLASLRTSFLIWNFALFIQQVIGFKSPGSKTRSGEENEGEGEEEEEEGRGHSRRSTRRFVLSAHVQVLQLSRGT